MLNGVSELFMMKADVLARFDHINVCTQYEMKDGSKVDHLTFEAMNKEMKPVLQPFESWPQIDKDGAFDELPESLLEYVQFVETQVKTPVSLVSCGPDRNQTIHRQLSPA